MSQSSKTLYAHPFRKNGTTHTILTTARKAHRRGQPLLCGKRLTKDFQRLAPSMHRMGLTPVTCDSCVRSMTGLMEVLENGNY